MKLLITAIGFLLITGTLYANNYALNFDGVNDYVSLNPTLSFSTSSAITIEGWIYPRSFNPSSPDANISNIAGYSGAFALVRIGDADIANNQLQFILAFSEKLNSNSRLNANTWYHFAAVFDGTTISLYLNGTLDNSMEYSGTFTSAGNFILGGQTDDTRMFDGLMDEIRVWNTARTEVDIKSNMYKEITSHANLQAYYKMSDGSDATLTDNSGNSNTGSISNGATWKASGAFAGPRQALDFDGTNDYVTIPHNNQLDLTINYTIEAWIKPSTFNCLGGIVGKYHTVDSNGYTLRLSSDSPYNGIIFDSTSTATGILTANQWQHIAAVNDGGTRKVYLNGIEQPLTGTPNVQSNSDPVIIGKDFLAETGTRYFNGEIDEVRIWNTVRTETQLLENMMTTLAGNEAGLIAYYRMDQYDGTTLYDMAANGHHGTLTNMDTPTDWVSSTAFNTWIGSESSVWTTSGNWSKNSSPVSTDNVGLYKLSSLANEATISGIPTVNSLYFSSGATPTLSSGFTVNGNLLLGKDIDMSGNTINLGSSATLIEESYTLFGSGNITTTRNLSNLSAENVAGLGAILTTSANLGSTTINRAHTAQDCSGNTSILRYYDITPTTNTGLNATLLFNYNDSELNGLTETDLELCKSTDGGTNWSNSGGVLNTADNTITVTAQDGFSRWTAAIPSYSLYFDGVNDYCLINSSSSIPSGSSTYSWECWVNATTTTDKDRKIFSWGSAGVTSESIQIGFDSSGKVIMNHWSNDYTTSYEMPQNTWVHLAGTYDGSTETLYINGVLTDSVTAGSLQIPANTELRIGDLITGNYGQFFHGALRDFRIWNVALSEATIQSWKDQIVTASHPNYVNLVSYYTMYEGSGITLDDSEGSNSLTIYGSAWFQEPMAVIYDANTADGGTVPTDAVNYLLGDSVTVPDNTGNLIKIGYTFDGWNTAADENGTTYQPGNTFSMGTANTTLYAKWLEEPNNALAFDGLNDYVSLSGINFNAASAITIEGWIKPRSFNAADPDANISNIITTSANDSVIVRLGDSSIDNNQLQFVIDATQRVSSNIRFSANIWYHFAAVFDGSTMSLYINGSFDNSINYSGSFTSSGNFILGGQDGVVRDLDGFIDDIRIWNIARTQQEISDNMRLTLAGDEAGLVAYYKMNHSSGTTLSDSSSNGHSGTLTNMDNSAWVSSDAHSIPSYTITGTARYWTGSGSISPASQSVNEGTATNLTVTPDTGSSISTVTGCGGTRSGNTYTTGTISGDCEVTATFTLNSYTITSTANAGGSIAPATRTVNHGETTSFSIQPNWGYTINGVTGCSGGALSENIYTTGAATADCTLTASFDLNSYTVTGLTTANGTISPVGAQPVNHGGTITFTVTPAPGYSINTVLGCRGTLNGNSYTTDTINGPCKVMAFFK